MATMEITTRIGCKVACAYCPQDKIVKAYIPKSEKFEMTFDVFKTCVDKIPVNVGIDFSGMGEPWLNPECTRMLLYAHERGHKIGVFTTLIGMHPSDIERIQNVPFVNFIVHLPAAEGWERINVNADYLDILEKISTSRIRARYKTFQGVPHPEVHRLLKRNGKVVHFVTTITRGGNLKNKPSPPRRTGAIACARDQHYNILLPNGDVILCGVDFGLRHVIGNLLSSDYGSLFRSEEFLRVRRGLQDDHEDTLCRTCDCFAVANRWQYHWRRLMSTPAVRDLYQDAKETVLKIKDRFLPSYLLPSSCPGTAKEPL